MRHRFAISAVIGFFCLALSAFGQQWNSLTPLPDGYAMQTLSCYNGFLYQVGGYSYINGPSDGINVFYTKVNTNGTIGNWQNTSYLPVAVYSHAAVAADGFIYVIAGYHADNINGIYADSNVYSAKINLDGSLGSWKTNTCLPQSAVNLGAAVWNNKIYVTVGTDGENLFSNTFSATIQPDGTLSAWESQPSLPAEVFAQGEVANGYLYVLGGFVSGGTELSADVYYSKINKDGSLASWNQTTSLPQASSYFGTIAANGWIFTIAGYNGASCLNSCYGAPVNGDGTIGAWISLANYPQLFAAMGTTANGLFIFSTGGQDSSGNANPNCYSFALPTPPPTPSLIKSNFIDGIFNLQLTSISTNLGFGLRASTDLMNWTNIGWGFTHTNGRLLFSDTNTVSFPNRFYQAYWPLP
ncbi:MAG TPA: hypothetical protein VK811_00215 [Candidatus Acidoferrum sp.]|jgi:hypothetical protein|nr:hypothetical protein [Candidatus Acidoferrum sp.]